MGTNVDADTAVGALSLINENLPFIRSANRNIGAKNRAMGNAFITSYTFSLV